jgi:hypothetical protein
MKLPYYFLSIKNYCRLSQLFPEYLLSVSIFIILNHFSALRWKIYSGLIIIIPACTCLHLQVQSVLMQDIIRVSKRYIIGNYFWNTFLLVFLVDELVTINATPIIIMLVAINVCNDIGSLSMAHPKNLLYQAIFVLSLIA